LLRASSKSSDSGAALLHASSQSRVSVVPAKELPESPRRLSLRPSAPSLRLACCLFASLRAASSNSGLRSAYFSICPPRSTPNAFADGLRSAAKVAFPTVAPRGFDRPLGLSKARSSIVWNAARSATLRSCERARTSCICGVKRKGKKKTCVEVRCWLCIFQFLIRLFS